MCTSEKFCFGVPLNIGCIIVGIISGILSIILFSMSTLFFILEIGVHKKEVTEESVHFAKYLGLYLNSSSVHIILSITVIISLLWMMFSILLILGILRNNANFVLSHFLFGTMMNIISMLSALLVLLQSLESWKLSFILFAWSFLHIHFLVVIYTAYDLMNKGKDFSFNQRADDEDLLADYFDDSLDSL
uniref:SFRICE_029327 n=1 Tax=Spodoptera frugiperda TaxID=7108 RepID=A0A2H1V4B9_SPOFR